MLAGRRAGGSRARALTGEQARDRDWAAIGPSCAGNLGYGNCLRHRPGEGCKNIRHTRNSPVNRTNPWRVQICSGREIMANFGIEPSRGWEILRHQRPRVYHTRGAPGQPRGE